LSGDAAVLAGQGLRCASCGQPLGYLVTDKLTGLLDRWGWDQHAGEAFARLGRQPAALLLLDLDRFKIVNDEHGHLAGDAVLQAMAAAMRDAVREGDILGRFGGHGGDEFLAFLPATAHWRGVLTAKRIRDRMRRTTVTTMSAATGGTVELSGLSASIGVGLHEPGRDGDLTALLRQADAALLRAKRGGRNRIALVRG
jgi:diguanylate cyclase (GGDEF)-like protein